MLRLLSSAISTGFVLVLASSAVLAQGNTINVRGTIEAFDGKVVTIKTSEGATAKVEVPEAARIATTKPFAMKDVKAGMTLGVTTIKRADGKTVAIDLRPIPPAARQGLFPYDLAPQSTMTNAKLEGAVAGAPGGQEITLNHGKGSVKVLVTDKTAMSRAAPGTRADIKAGETIYVFADNKDGKLKAIRLQVSKDGVKPTQ